MSIYVRLLFLLTASVWVGLEGCEFVELPEHVLRRIAYFLPSYVDVVHVRKACRSLYKVFRPAVLRLGSLGQIKADESRMHALYTHLSHTLLCMSGVYRSVKLDLSHSKVERFMFGKYSGSSCVKKLRMSSCSITSERDNFFDCASWANLESIDLSNNFLGKRDKELSSSGDWDSGANIWSSLCSLPKLKSCNLRNNQIYSIPHELSNCTQLEYLDLSDNPLEVGQIEALRHALPKATIIA